MFADVLVDGFNVVLELSGNRDDRCGIGDCAFDEF